MIVVSIDPGLSKVAIAIWNESRLIWAGLVREDHEPGIERVQKWRNMAYWANQEIDLHLPPSIVFTDLELVIEVPQVYRVGKSKGDPNDLIDLAGVVGAIAGFFNERLDSSIEWSPVPREWKGQIPKEVTQKRVDAALSDEEKAAIDWPIKSMRHDVYDAIHLGLVYLKREGLREIA